MSFALGQVVVAARSAKVKGSVIELVTDKTHGQMYRIECTDGIKRVFREDDLIAAPGSVPAGAV